jgi:hypothetical protein
MPRSFNTAGPCRPEADYMSPPSARLPGVMDLVERQKYFVLHAPRQTGKTTALRALAQDLSATRRFAAVMVSAEVGAAFPRDPLLADRQIIGDWRRDIAVQLPAELQPPSSIESDETVGGFLYAFELKVWRDGRRDPLAEGLAQLDAYLARLDLATGWLVVFDQRSGLAPIEERTSAAEAKTPAGRRVTVIRG